MADRNDYTPHQGLFSNLKVDQSITANSWFLPYLSGLNYEAATPELVPKEEWFPSVNSYYAFTEDVDAFARVNHLIDTKCSLDSLESKELADGRPLLNEYSRKKAQEQYLQSQPLCFLTLGKPGLDQEELGRRLSEYWKCIYIDPYTLLDEALSSGNRAGQCIEFNLRCGRAIDINVIIRLLGKKVQSPTSLHRGFILCGFPLVANDLYEEDPISLESAIFSVQEIFEEIIDTTIHIVNDSDKVEVSMIGSKDPSEQTGDKSVIDDGEKLPQNDVTFVWSFHSEICGSDDKVSIDLETQINFLFGLFRDPFMIIYLYCSNSDAVTKRNNYLFDYYSKRTVDMQKIKNFFQFGALNQELTEDLFDNGRNPFAKNPNLKYLVKLPENLPANVHTQLDRYHKSVANLLDCRIMLHDYQYFIKLDVRSFISHMLQLIKMRLQILPVQNVLLPQKINSVLETVDKTAKSELKQSTLEDTFRKFSKEQVVASKFKWIWSDWGTFCPVSMSKGNYQQGSPNFAVHFMNQIFFLADKTAYDQFSENPRLFLCSPFPKPGSRLFIFGPPVSGKTAVSKCLGYVLNSKVLSPREMYEQFIQQVIQEYKEKVHQIAITEGFEILKKQKLLEFNDKFNIRKEQIQEWEEQAVDALTDLSSMFLKSGKQKSIEVISSFPMKLEQAEDEEVRSMNEEIVIRNRLNNLNLPNVSTQSLCEHLLRDREVLLRYLPKHLQGDITVDQPSVYDDFVVNYVTEKMEQITSEHIKREAEENKLEMYTRCIRGIQSEPDYEGWIIDGMTTDINLLSQIWDEFPADDVIILTAEHDDFLIERFKQNLTDSTEFRNFRNFFINIGEKDAAWRTPSEESNSLKKKIVTDILNDTVSFVQSATVEEKEPLFKKYEKKLKKYQEDIENVETFFEKLGVKPVKIDVTDLKLEQLLKESIEKLRDKYRRQASVYTETDRAEDVQEVLERSVRDQESESADIKVEDLFTQKRHFGDSHFYCPVTFVDNFILWKGKEQFAAKFEDEIYLMSSEKNFKNFIKFPRNYILKIQPPDRLPPPRICVVGVQGSGKSTVSKILAKNLGIRYCNFRQRKREAVENFSSTSIFLDSEELELPDKLLFDFYDKLFFNLWFQAPLKYSGFVLDGFPQKSRDITYQIKYGAIPDMVINISVKYEEHIKKMLEHLMNDWRKNKTQTRTEQEAMNKIIYEQWEDIRKLRYNELMEMKRESRYSKEMEDVQDPTVNQKNKFTSETQLSFDSVADQQDHEEVLKILNEELPEPDFEEDEETEEQVAQQFLEELENNYKEYVEHLSTIKQICETELIPWVEIDGSSSLQQVLAHAFVVTEPIKSRNLTLFQHCDEVSVEIAEKLLATGYYLLSFFGRFCPVEYHEYFNSLYVYVASKLKNEIYPIIHRQYIYFLNGIKNRDRFMKDPLQYTSPKYFNCPLIPMRIAIIGPPKSGKTTLANRFNRDLAFKVISRGQAIRYTLEHLLLKDLADPIDKLLRAGETLTDQMVIDCVYAATFCGEAATYGLVFDGFPNTINEINLMSRVGLVPHLVFDLKADDYVIYDLSLIPNENHLLQYNWRFIEHHLKEWRKTQEEFRTWCDREYQNIYKLLVDCCIWGIWEQVKEIIFAIMSERKHYYKHAQHDWPLRLANMLVTPLEFLERQSEYKTYCPVCLYYSRRLTNGGEPPDRTGLIQFREYFYWLCEKHIDEFLKIPDKFLPPSNVCLPQELPHVESLDEVPKQAVEDGYCVVCYQQNFPKKVLNKGDKKYAVSYRGKLFLFDSVDCLTNFMVTPQELCYVTINFKEEQGYSSLGYRDLPVIGMLEQYVARNIVRAVSHVNVYRPVIPGLSISACALICVGLNLKIYNPNTSKNSLSLYKMGLEAFHQRRSDLIKYLDLMKKYLNPQVFYKEPVMYQDQDDEEIQSYTDI